MPKFLPLRLFHIVVVVVTVVVVVVDVLVEAEGAK